MPRRDPDDLRDERRKMIMERAYRDDEDPPEWYTRGVFLDKSRRKGKDRGGPDGKT